MEIRDKLGRPLYRSDDARLTPTELDGANLMNADLRGFDLQGLMLTDTNLRGADLTEANFYWSVLIGETWGNLGGKVVSSL